MSVYYNEIDAFAAAWLRELIKHGHLPAGDVDERSIVDVPADDIRGYRQHHFFAGIGGWPYALRLAGWPDDRPVWTGSCPCQPFSSAGRQGGALDERHLWPRWLRLIEVCKPDTILGEQVEGAVGFGWIDRVFADLEAEGYTCGAAVLGAHSVGAPHIRQRLFWVAQSSGGGWNARPAEEQQQSEERAALAHDGGAAGWVADADAAGGNGRDHRGDAIEGAGSGRSCDTGWLGDTARGEMGRARQPWQDSVWLPCLDGKARRVEPSIQPLATGIPNRVGLLRGSGNAITPQAAAEFVKAFMECLP